MLLPIIYFNWKFISPLVLIALIDTPSRKCIDDDNLIKTFIKLHLTVKIDLVEVDYYLKLFQTGISFAIKAT